MKPFSAHRLLTVFLIVGIALAAPAYGEESAPAPTGEGLTRDSLTESTTAAQPPTSTHARATRRHRRRIDVDPKDFLSVHRHHESPRAAKPPARVAASRPARRRNPVTSFVYWWNGWVIRNFHTKAGTVMLGSVGAKS